MGAVPAVAAPSLATLGSALAFPVRRVFCVGRNYAAHAREMGADPTREAPFFFTKSAHAVVGAPCTVPYPPATAELHHEVELVVALGGDSGGRVVAPQDALGLVWGYGVGLDLTRRDLQAAAKAARRPWCMGKDFDASAPVSELAPVAAVGHPSRGRVWLERNGAAVQEGCLSHQIWDVPELLAQLSGLIRLCPGDLVFTGTPAGVGPVERGDTLSGGIEGVGNISVTFI